MSVYRVAVDNGAGKSWVVVGPGDVALGQSWENQDDAEEVAEMLNNAFANGLAVWRNLNAAILAYRGLKRTQT